MNTLIELHEHIDSCHTELELIINHNYYTSIDNNLKSNDIYKVNSLKKLDKIISKLENIQLTINSSTFNNSNTECLFENYNRCNSLINLIKKDLQ